MSNRAYWGFVCFVACALACAAGVFVGIRLNEPVPPPAPTAADFAAAMRDYIESTGDFHISYFKVEKIDGDTAYVVMRVPELMPEAQKYRVYLKYGWSLRRPEPRDEHTAGP